MPNVTGEAPRRHVVPIPLEIIEQGACRNTDVNMIPGIYDEEGTEYAIRVCDSCPVRAVCLRYALTEPQAGVWGGLSERDRIALRKTLPKVEEPPNPNALRPLTPGYFPRHHNPHNLGCWYTWNRGECICVETP